MTTKQVKALVLTGFGINCDHETQYALQQAGAETDRIHLNRLIQLERQGRGLAEYHIMAVDGGFSWADDHGAGVILGLKLRAWLGEAIERFIADGKLVIGVCNGFQALVNMGLLPGFGGDYRTRSVALTANDCGNFRDDWVHLQVNESSRCVFSSGIRNIDLPIRHGEGKLFAPPEVIQRLKDNGQVVLRYAKAEAPPLRGLHHPLEHLAYAPAEGAFPENPNGSLDDIAGICDETGRVFGLMPHPEAFHHAINHPNWTRIADYYQRKGQQPPTTEGEGLAFFKNGVQFVKDHLL